MIYHDNQLYYLRKPAGRPSTRGKTDCFLDKLVNGEYEIYLQQYHMSQGYDTLLYKHAQEQFQELGLEPVSDIHALTAFLMQTFGPDQEYGLVNRLDTPTAGFLYFAKNPYVYGHYRKRQNQGRVKKYYLALVKGDMSYLIKKKQETNHLTIKKNSITIKTPLMHHAQLDDRMVAIKAKKDLKKGRGKSIEKKTRIKILDYDKKEEETLILAKISAGARHQIRAHLASIGYPILGDKIYAKKTFINQEQNLHLRSIGCDINAKKEVLVNFSRIRDLMNEPIRLPGDKSPNLRGGRE